ncbi:MAG: hypothetical protein WAM42_21570 [Candidatus Nitrosopolaris sp.]
MKIIGKYTVTATPAVSIMSTTPYTEYRHYPHYPNFEGDFGLFLVRISYHYRYFLEYPH